MIWDLITGLLAVAAGFTVIMLLCVAIGKTAGLFSAYKDIN